MGAEESEGSGKLKKQATYGRSWKINDLEELVFPTKDTVFV